MMEILNQYVQVLWECFAFDIKIFSNQWMYIPLLVPVTGYALFFMIKWSILTGPFWIPLMAIFHERQITKDITKK